MNILILTGKFGMGHIKCANAIKEQITASYPDANVDIVDFCEFCFQKTSKLIYKGFETAVYKFSYAYNKLGAFTNKLNCVPFKRMLHRRMDKMMEAYSPDLVIADLPMAVQYYASYKKAKNVKISFYVYITDITIHSDWISKSVDKYFVGSRCCAIELVKRGISRYRIHISGIPVSDAFSKNPEKLMKKPNVLVMGGGLGLIPCQDRILSALNNSKEVNATIICGKNEKLLKEVTEKYPYIKAVGFTNNVPGYLTRADVIITKPGGITTFEAIKSHTPLFIFEPSLLQEQGNSNFIKKKGLGLVIKDEASFSEETLLSFIKDKEEINNIKERMEDLSRSFESVNPMDYFEVA